ncbi:glutathione S-transferase U25-like [Curcuma longa]|uniref:glutathione S-transferase U25-like n=1 Tax=Curcuma longa TaxID=136217 RepID=UPI003D9ED09D
MEAVKGVALLNCWASPYGLRCKVALAEKAVEYEYREENLMDKSALLLQANPVHKKVPVLIHDGRAVCESLLILHYIDEVWPTGAPLLPAEPYGRAQARFWADFADKKIFDAGIKMVRSDGEVAAEAREVLVEALKTLEGELGEKAYFGSEGFGFVDVVVAPIIVWCHAFEKYGGFTLEAEAPKLAAWGKRCVAERESVAKALPDGEKLVGFLGSLRKHLGLE